MANFNFGIDCETSEQAHILFKFINSLMIFQQELEIEETRISLVSKQTLLCELELFFEQKAFSGTVEVWPVEVSYDEADNSGILEVYAYDSKK